MAVQKTAKIPYKNIERLDFSISDDMFFVGRIKETQDLYYYNLKNDEHGYLKDFNARVLDLQDIEDDVIRNTALAKLFAEKEGLEPIFSDIIRDYDKIDPYKMKIEGDGYFDNLKMYIYCSEMENMELRFHDYSNNKNYNIPISVLLKKSKDKKSIIFDIEKMNPGKYYLYFNFKGVSRPEKMGIIVFDEKLIFEY